MAGGRRCAARMLGKSGAALLFAACLLALPTPAGAFTMPPPWVILWGSVAFAKTFATVKDIVLLIIDVVFGGEGAMCTLCDKIITIVLAGDAEGGIDEINCEGVCFRLDRCVKICDKLKTALATSASFPCVAAGYCPAVDEFGPLPKCQYKFPASCAPANMCAFKFPKCELSEGYKKWRKMNSMLTENLGAVAGALTKMPKCGEPGAHKTFCVNEPTGVGLYCKNCAYFLYIWACIQSVMAIESPGGDDDRQWLSFWIIFLIFNVFEAMTDVLLSWLPSYFEMKFVFLCWLIFFNGADILYRKVHNVFGFFHSVLVRFGLIEEEEEEEWDEEDYLHELPNGLADDIRAQGGVLNAFGDLVSTEMVLEEYGKRRGAQLLRMFEKVQPRWVEVTLVRAENLAAMDNNGLSDPYCVLTLVAPQQAIKACSDHGGSFRSLSGLMGMATQSFRSLTSFRRSSEASAGSSDANAGADPTDATPSEAQDKTKFANAKKSWGTVKSKMVDAKVITKNLNSLKRSISDPRLQQLESEASALRRSNSENDLGGADGDGSSKGSAASASAAAAIAGLFVKQVSSVVQNGPRGPTQQYAKVTSKCIPKTLNPEFNQVFEMHLEGGEIDKNGDYHNPHAAFTKFRLTMWDHDTLSQDDFMGEITVPLGPLMSCRTLEGWYDLEDPEGAYDNDDDKPLSGRVYLKLKWNSEALLQGSVRPKGGASPELPLDSPLRMHFYDSKSPSDPIAQDLRSRRNSPKYLADGICSEISTADEPVILSTTVPAKVPKALAPQKSVLDSIQGGASSEEEDHVGEHDDLQLKWQGLSDPVAKPLSEESVLEIVKPLAAVGSTPAKVELGGTLQSSSSPRTKEAEDADTDVAADLRLGKGRMCLSAPQSQEGTALAPEAVVPSVRPYSRTASGGFLIVSSPVTSPRVEVRQLWEQEPQGERTGPIQAWISTPPSPPMSPALSANVVPGKTSDEVLGFTDDGMRALVNMSETLHAL